MPYTLIVRHFAKWTHTGFERIVLLQLKMYFILCLKNKKKSCTQWDHHKLCVYPIIAQKYTIMVNLENISINISMSTIGGWNSRSI